MVVPVSPTALPGSGFNYYSQLLFNLVEKKSDKLGGKMNYFCDRLLYMEIFCGSSARWDSIWL